MRMVSSIQSIYQMEINRFFRVFQVSISIRSQCSIGRTDSVLLAFGFIYAKTCMLALRSISDLTAEPVLIILLPAMPLMWTSAGFIRSGYGFDQQSFPLTCPKNLPGPGERPQPPLRLRVLRLNGVYCREWTKPRRDRFQKVACLLRSS